jgi:hypothetical protein
MDRQRDAQQRKRCEGAAPHETAQRQQGETLCEQPRGYDRLAIAVAEIPGGQCNDGYDRQEGQRAVTQKAERAVEEPTKPQQLTEDRENHRSGGEAEHRDELGGDLGKDREPLGRAEPEIEIVC